MNKSALADQTPAAGSRRSTGHNTVVMVGSHLVSRALLMVAFTVAARATGPDLFGQLNVALGILAFLGLFADPGLHYVAQRALAGAPDEARQLVARVNVLRVMLAAIAVGASGAAHIWLSTQTSLLTLLYALTLVPSAVALTWAYSGAERFLVVAVANVLHAVIYLAWILLAVRSPEDVTLVPLGLLAANVGSTVLQRALAPVSWKRPRLVSGFNNLWSLLRGALPFGAALLMAQLLVWIDSFLLLALQDSRAVGIYHAAYRWILVTVGLAAYVPQTLFPRLIRLGGSKEGRALMQDATRVTLQLGMMATVFLFGLSPILVAKAFGADYEDAQSVLRILVLLIPFAMHNALAVHYLNARQREFSSVKIAAVAVAVNLLLNVALIPRQGVAGAAWALVLTEVLIAFMCVFAVGKTGIIVKSTYGAFTLSALPAMFPLLLVSQPPILRALGAFGLLLGGLALTGELKPTRLKQLHRSFWRSD